MMKKNQLLIINNSLNCHNLKNQLKIYKKKKFIKCKEIVKAKEVRQKTITKESFTENQSPGPNLMIGLSF